LGLLHQNEIMLDDRNLKEFYRYLKLERGIKDKTLKRYEYDINKLIHKFEGKIRCEDVKNHLERIKNEYDEDTYRNVLINIRVFLRWLKFDWLEGFKVARRGSREYDTLPSLEDIRVFYYAIDHDEVRLIYLLYAVSGRRRDEILYLIRDEIDIENRCIKPRSDNPTKRKGVSFFNDEVKNNLIDYINSRNYKMKECLGSRERRLKGSSTKLERLLN